MTPGDFRLTAPDGMKLHVHVWLPSQPVRGVFQIAHGLAEHAGRYARVAAPLCAAGWAVYAQDHRGHGKTALTPEDLGFWGHDGWARCVEDLHQVQQHAAAAHPGKPVVLLGHSMGSFMVQQHLYTYPGWVAAAVLSASNGPPPAVAKPGIHLARLERWRLGASGRSALMNAASFGHFNRAFKPCRTPFDWLSRDPAEVDKYRADPACGFVASAGLWCDLLPALFELTLPQNLARIPKRLPIWVMAGDQDPASQATAGLQGLLKAYAQAGLTGVTHTFYPQARHELLNETNRDEVTQDLLSFVKGILN